MIYTGTEVVLEFLYSETRYVQKIYPLLTVLLRTVSYPQSIHHNQKHVYHKTIHV